MKRLLVLVSLMMGMAGFAEEAKKPEAGLLLPVAADDTIVITSENSVSLHDVISQQSLAPVLQKLIELDAKLPVGKPLYLILNSPGGEIVAGANFIDAVKGLSRPVHTITLFAASMAFITAQNLGDRLITENGVLMSHRASGGVEGQIPGEIDVQLAFWERYIDKIQESSAKRMGLTSAELTKKHYNQLWMTGSDAIAQKAADKVVKVRCGADLIGTENKEVHFFIFTFNVTMSKCPLVTGPLKVEMAGGAPGAKKAEGDAIDQEVAKRDTEKFINELYYNKHSFVTDYIINGEYKKFTKIK